MAGEAKSRVIVAGRALDGTIHDVLVDTSGIVQVAGGAGGGGGDGAILDGVSATIKATVFDYVNSNPLAAQLVDSAGNPVSVGGGTQYAEDSASLDAEQLTMAGVVRKDARGTMVSADGDRTELQVNASGDLRTDGSAVTQPISAVSLPLPTGAATEATLAGVKTGTDKIPASPSTDRTTAAGPFAVRLSDGAAFYDGRDVSDRAGRLVGVVYGSQAQQLKQTATNFNLQVESAVGGTLIDPRDVSDRSGRLVGVVSGGANVFHVDDNAASLTVDAPVATPVASRLSDGAAFYDAAKTGQLPSALVSGRLDVNIGAPTVFPVSDNAGSLTVDAPVGTPVAARLSDGAAFLTTTSGRLAVDASGVAVPVTDNAGSLTVDNAGTFAVQDSQVIADNAGFTDGTSKVFPVGYIFDEVAGTALTENDIGAARMDSKRATISVIEDETTRGRRVTVTAANALKVDGSAVTQPVSIAAAVKTNVEPETSGGLTIYRLLSAATTNGNNIKGSAGQVYGWYFYNANAAVRYVKLYNKATAPTVGTDTPVMTIPIPPASAANVEFSNGIAFATGIGIGITTGVADADTGAVAANEIVVNLLYK